MGKEVAVRLAEESFRHNWDSTDERRIDGVWVSGLCCECGDFVAFGKEVEHVAAALEPLIQSARADAWDKALGSCNDYTGDAPNPYQPAHLPTAEDQGDGSGVGA